MPGNEHLSFLFFFSFYKTPFLIWMLYPKINSNKKVQIQKYRITDDPDVCRVENLEQDSKRSLSPPPPYQRANIQSQPKEQKKKKVYIKPALVVATRDQYSGEQETD